MKLILAAILISFSASADVQQIYSRLVQANGGKPIPLYILSGKISTCSLACTDGRKIIITQELLSLVHNDDELAGVIGHEMAHMVHSSELKADVLGLQYAQKAGYNYCRAAQFLKGLIGDDTHPSGAVRYSNTGCK